MRHSFRHNSYIRRIDGLKNGDEKGVDCGGSCEDCVEEKKEAADWIQQGLDSAPEPEPEGTDSAAVQHANTNSHFQTGAYERGDYCSGCTRFFPWVDLSSGYDTTHCKCRSSVYYVRPPSNLGRF